MKRSDIGPFAIVPEWLLNSVSGFITLKVWFVIARYSNVDDVAWPSQETIATRIGCDVSSVKRAIRELEALGAIEVSPRIVSGKGKQGNLYKVKYSQSGMDETMAAQSGMDEPWGGGMDETSLNKDEREPILTLANSLTPKSPLSDSDTPDPRTPDSVRDLPFTDREQSASDTPLIETGSPNQAPPTPEGKALRAADAIGQPDPEWAAEWQEWLQDRKDRRLPNTPRALNKQLELLRSDSDPKGVLEAAMRCAWKGLFPSKPAKGEKPRLADEINRYLAQ